MTITTSSELIEVLGGSTKLSRLLGCTRQNVAMMKINGLPDKYSTRLAFDSIVKSSQKLNPRETQSALSLVWSAPDE